MHNEKKNIKSILRLPRFAPPTMGKVDRPAGLPQGGAGTYTLN